MYTLLLEDTAVPGGVNFGLEPIDPRFGVVGGPVW